MRPSSGRSPALRRAAKQCPNKIQQWFAKQLGMRMLLREKYYLTLMCKNILTLYCFIKKVRNILEKCIFTWIFEHNGILNAWTFSKFTYYVPLLLLSSHPQSYRCRPPSATSLGSVPLGRGIQFKLAGLNWMQAAYLPYKI